MIGNALKIYNREGIKIANANINGKKIIQHKLIRLS